MIDDADINITTLLSNPAIPTTPLMDYSLTNYLQVPGVAEAGENWEEYGYNITWTNVTGVNLQPEPLRDTSGNIVLRGNNLWTEISKAKFGFIVPGTRTYAVFGSSAGHQSGIGYKIIPQGKTDPCPGPCTFDPDDSYNYYWLWDMAEVAQVLNGSKQPHEIVPYDYGVFNAPFQTNKATGEFQQHSIGHGYYDAANSKLYLSLIGAGQLGDFDRPPLFLVYSLSLN